MEKLEIKAKIEQVEKGQAALGVELAELQGQLAEAEKPEWKFGDLVRCDEDKSADPNKTLRVLLYNASGELYTYDHFGDIQRDIFDYQDYYTHINSTIFDLMANRAKPAEKFIIKDLSDDKTMISTVGNAIQIQSVMHTMNFSLDKAKGLRAGLDSVIAYMEQNNEKR